MSFDARWYSLLHTGFENDADYYVAAVRGAREVVELGCGFGRITLPLAKSGVCVVGVDNSPSMLALLEEASAETPDLPAGQVTLMCADMREFTLGRTVDAVLIPYNGLLCLLDEASVRDCLRRAALHLAPGGLLLFDVYDVPAEALEEGAPDEDGADDLELIEAFEHGDEWVQVFERSLPHEDPRRFDVEYIYTAVDDLGAEREATRYAILQRCLLKEELPSLLQAAGFGEVSITSDFTDGPVTDETEQLVVRARRL